MDLPPYIPYEVVLVGPETETMTVEDYANFLRDLVFLHDRLWIVASKERAAGYNLSAGWFYTRYGRPVPENQRLVLTSALKRSPFELGILIASAAEVGRVAWLFFQIIRGLLLLPGELEKQDLENEKLKHDNREDYLSSRASGPLDLRADLRDLAGTEREDADTVLHLVQRDVERLKGGRLQITETRVTRTIKRLG
jgi:hypothetical protein